MDSERLPWNDVNSFFRRRFGGRVAKVLVNTGRPCPHRSATGGCVFCDEVSILPSYLRAPLSVSEQVRRGLAARSSRTSVAGCIAYFQRGTGTAAPVGILRQEFEEALSVEAVVGLAVGTRPDCLPDPVLELIAELAQRVPVFVDLGLQSAHPDTLSRIRRGHDVAVFQAAVRRLADLPDVYPIAHMILGLPGEDAVKMRASFRWLAGLPLHGVKIHHLQVVRGTPLEAEFRAGGLRVLEPEEYVPLVADVLEELPSRFVVHRLAGDQPAAALVAPRWTWTKTRLRHELTVEFGRRGTRQGAQADDKQESAE
jgi:hypothetical protein